MADTKFRGTAERWTLVCSVVSVLMLCPSKDSHGQDPASAASEQDLTHRRVEVMKSRILSLQVDGAEGGKQFAEEPILRYSDPTRRITDASVWRLGQSGRPNAIVVLEVYSGTSIQIEPTAVVDPPKQIKGKGWQWTPENVAFEWTTIPIELSDSAEVPQLKRQAKTLARQFSAEEAFRGQTYQLRLMPKPLLDYVDTDKSVAAGEMFAWAHGTNVEVLMFVEAQQGADGKMSWKAGFSRLGAASIEIKYDGKSFWSAPAMPSTSSRNAYYYRMVSMTPLEREAFSE